MLLGPAYVQRSGRSEWVRAQVLKPDCLGSNTGSDICIYVCMCMCVYVYICRYGCLYACIFLHIYTHTYTYMFIHTHVCMIRAEMDPSVEQMKEPSPREKTSLNQSQTLSSKSQWWVLRFPIPSSVLNKLGLSSFTRGSGYDSLSPISLPRIQARGYCSIPGSWTTSHRLQNTMPNSAVPQRAAAGSARSPPPSLPQQRPAALAWSCR